MVICEAHKVSTAVTLNRRRR